MNFPQFNPNLLLQATQNQPLLPIASSSNMTFPSTSFGPPTLPSQSILPNIEQLLADSKNTKNLASEHLKMSAEDIFRLQEQVTPFLLEYNLG